MADTLEARLIALGESLEFPRLDSLADDVIDALDTRRRRRRRPLLVAAAILLVVTATVAVAVPGSRQTVARWLGFDELRIERVEVIPPTVTAPLTDPPVTMTDPVAELRADAARVGVDPLVAADLGTPVAIETPLDRYLMVRYAEADLVLLPGTVEPDLFVKLVGTTAEVRTVALFGGSAYWITGDPHVLMYIDEDGDVAEVRPVEDTLIWQRGSVIVRIEGDVSLERATEIARSVGAP